MSSFIASHLTAVYHSGSLWLGSCGFIDWAQTGSGLGESEKRR